MSRIIRVITYGGLGDVLLATPSIKALRKKYPQAEIRVYCTARQHMEIFRGNPHVNKIRMASFLSAPVDYILYVLKWARFYTMDYGLLLPSICYRKNATAIIAEMMDVQLEEKQLEVFLSAQEEAAAREMLAAWKNPVMLHVNSITSKNQEWPLKNWEQLIREMPGYTFIQLGVEKDTMVRGAVDMRGKTSFRQALALIKYARAFAGVVSSFSHATNAFNTPGVILFGASAPEVWGHANNINIFKAPRCAPCIDVLLGSLCPYNKPCMHNITVTEVKQQLLKQLRAETIVI